MASSRLNRAADWQAALSPAAVAILNGHQVTRAMRASPRDGPITARAGATSAPLSSHQQRLWLLDQFDPGSVAYNRPRAFHLSGPLDQVALERALTELVRRHHVLRSAVTIQDGVPVQSVLPAGPVVLQHIDLAGADVDDIDAARRDALTAEANRPFDLGTGPFMRASLIRTGAGEQTLLVVQHHIASDGFSDAILFRELGDLYDAYTKGTSSLSPEAPLQYGDFAAWQRARLDGEAFAPELAYWRRQLAGAPSVLELPTDHPRPSRGLAGGAREFLTLPRSLTEALTAIGREGSATFSMTLLAAFQLLLARYASADDIVVGVPVDGRTRAELEPMIGFFANTLVVRTALSDEITFRELLERVRQSALEAYAHQELPVDALVEMLHPERTLRHAPLVQVLFNVRPPEPQLRMDGLRVTPLDVHPAEVVADLSLDVVDRPDGVSCVAHYATALWDASTMARMLGHYRTLLEGIVATPDLPIARLPLLTPEERHQILVEWNATDRPLPYEQCLHDLVLTQLRRWPDVLALVDEQTELTGGEIDRRARHLAADLRRRGIGPNVLVGVCMERSVDLVVTLLAVLEAGGAYVPLDPSYPADRVAFTLQDTAAPVVIADARTVDRLPASPSQVLVVDDAYWRGAGDENEDPMADAAPGPRAGPGDLAYVIYTSGSTGRPKGVLNTHRGICNRILWGQRTYGLTPHDRVLQKTPFGFDVSVWEIFWPLMAGARLVVARPEGHLDNRYLAEVIERDAITTVHFVPSMLQIFLADVDVAACSRGLRRILASGEALPAALQERVFERLPHVELHNLYGPTEAAVEVSAWACEPGGTRSSVPIGRPIANIQLYVLDALREPVPIGVVGELYIGGIGVARGYLNRPELTAERFIRDPFRPGPDARLYRTGDRARFDTDGVIEFLGRTDHQVKIQGVRIELGEIEAALASHPDVRESVVVTRELGGTVRLVAYVVPRTSGSLTDGELRQHLRDRLPREYVPAAFVLLDAIPLTPNGKVDRRSLPIPADAIRAERTAYLQPQTPTERLVADVWSDTLGIQRVGSHDDFFELGGNSLAAARVAARLRDALGVDLSIRTIFEHSTVATLAVALLARDDVPGSPLVLVQPGRSDRAPLFFLHGDYNGGGLYCRNLARQLGPAQPLYAVYPHLPGGPASIEAMAQDFAQLVRRVQPTGPYRLGGHCNGGLVAFEMARQLEAQGATVDFLALVSAAVPGTASRAWYRWLRRAADAVGISPERQAVALSTALGWRDDMRRVRRSLAAPGVGPRLMGRVAAVLQRADRARRSESGRASRAAAPPTTSGANSRVLPTTSQTLLGIAEQRRRMRYYQWAIYNYTPRVYGSRLTLVVPEDDPLLGGRHVADTARPWQRVCADMDVCTAPGDHFGVITTHVDSLGARLRARMDTLPTAG